MSRQALSVVRFYILAGFVLVASATAAAALWPRVLAAAHRQSGQLVNEAKIELGREAELDYRLATMLDHHNTTAYLQLARIYIAAGQADQAFALLDRAGQGSEAIQLRVRTLIELGRTGAAAGAATTLTQPSASSDDLMLATLAYLLAGRTNDTEALMPRLGSPEASQRIARAEANPIALAAELYATGLLNSSSTLLQKQPASLERNLLLGHIYYARHTPADLAQASNVLAEASAANPANLEAHQLLADVYRDQQKFSDASAQDALVVKLKAGRP